MCGAMPLQPFRNQCSNTLSILEFGVSAPVPFLVTSYLIGTYLGLLSASLLSIS